MIPPLPSIQVTTNVAKALLVPPATDALQDSAIIQDANLVHAIEPGQKTSRDAKMFAG